MRPVKSGEHAVQFHAHTQPLPFADVTAARFKEGLYIRPSNVCANRFGKNRGQCFFVPTVHTIMVLFFSDKSSLAEGSAIWSPAALIHFYPSPKMRIPKGVTQGLCPRPPLAAGGNTILRQLQKKFSLLLRHHPARRVAVARQGRLGQNGIVGLDHPAAASAHRRL